MTIEPVRNEVARFAIRMERKLLENDHKGGWDHCNFGYLFKRLEEELKEAKSAAGELTATTWDAEGDLDGIAEAAIDELADVANFAMMIADKIRTGSMGKGPQ